MGIQKISKLPPSPTTSLSSAGWSIGINILHCLRPTLATALAQGLCGVLRGCVLCSGVLCAVAFLFGASRNEPQSRIVHKSCENQKKGCRRHVLGVLKFLGGYPGSILGPGGPKVSAGTEKERNCELFPPDPGP